VTTQVLSVHQQNRAIPIASAAASTRLRAVLVSVPTSFDTEWEQDVPASPGLRSNLLEAGILAHRLMPGIGSCSVNEVVRLGRR
jgi:hypothetical protein